MVKKVAVIALDPRASAFYGKQVQELFGGIREGEFIQCERRNDFQYGAGGSVSHVNRRI